jgi:hypothetical protein
MTMAAPNYYHLTMAQRLKSVSTKSGGFSKIPHGFYRRIRELTGAQIKVWLAHRCMEGRDGFSYPSLDSLSTYTGITKSGIKCARKFLRDNGWLVSDGNVRTAKGHFSVPRERTQIPPVDWKPGHGEMSDGSPKTGLRTPWPGKTAAVKTGDGFSGPEVVPSSEVVPCEGPEVNSVAVGDAMPQTSRRSVAHLLSTKELKGLRTTLRRTLEHPSLARRNCAAKDSFNKQLSAVEAELVRRGEPTRVDDVKPKLVKRRA